MNTFYAVGLNKVFMLCHLIHPKTYSHSVGNYTFKVNNRNTRTLDAIGVVLVSLLLTLNTLRSSASIIKFEQVNTGWALAR